MEGVVPIPNPIREDNSGPSRGYRIFPLPQPEVTTRTRKRKRKLLLLADSNGIGFYRIFEEMTDMLDAYEILVWTKPNARLQEVVESIKDLTADFTRYDFVCIMAGSCNSHDPLKFPFKTIKNLFKSCKHASIVVCEVPFRYDVTCPDVQNDQISQINVALVNLIYKWRTSVSVYFLPINKYLYRNIHYTGHGLHLSLRGKVVVCKLLQALLPQFDEDY